MAMPVRLATFSLGNLDDRPDAGLPVAARIAVLRPQLVRLDADILFLQEVNGQPARAPRTLAALDDSGWLSAAAVLLPPDSEGPAVRAAVRTCLPFALPKVRRCGAQRAWLQLCCACP